MSALPSDEKNTNAQKTDNINDKETNGSSSQNENRTLLQRLAKALSRKTRWMIFTIFILLNIIINIDHGTVPAATEEIEKALKINDEQLGFFGSLVFLGTIIGSLISLSLINKFNRKYLLILSLILCGVCLISFTFEIHVYVLYANRVVVGMFQAFISIYLPVWCDQFGIKNQRTMMIALIQVAPPLGVVLGYVITVFCLKYWNSWKFPFIIQSVALWVVMLLLFFFPNMYFSSKFRRLPFDSDIEKNEEKPRMRTNSLFYEENTADFINSKSQDLLSNEQEKESSKKKRKRPLAQKLCIIFSQPIFDFSVLTLSSLFFVLTSIQYWGSNYMEKHLHVTEKTEQLISFAIVCLTSPTLGVLVGGGIINAMGGYETKHSILFCFIFSLFSSGFTIPVPFADSLLWFTVYLWLVLFFGGALMAPLTGIIITSLPKDLAGSGNSFTIFFCNLLGYLPAPMIYGFIEERFEDEQKTKRIAMKFCMWYSAAGVLFLLLATIYRYKNYDKIYKKNTMLINEGTETENEIDEERKQKIKEKTQQAVPKIFNGMVSTSDYKDADEEDEMIQEENPPIKEDIDDIGINIGSMSQRNEERQNV